MYKLQQAIPDRSLRPEHSAVTEPDMEPMQSTLIDMSLLPNLAAPCTAAATAYRASSSSTGLGKWWATGPRLRLNNRAECTASGRHSLFDSKM